MISISLLNLFSSSPQDSPSISECGGAPRLVVLFVLGLAVLHGLAAGGISEEEERRAALIRDLSLAERDYRVGIAAVVDVRAQPEDAQALGAYAEILRDALLEVPRRYLSEEERYRLRIKRVEERTIQAKTGRDRRLEELERDSIRNPETRDPTERELDESLLENDRTIRLLSTIKPEEVRLPPTIPVVVLEDDPVFRRTAPDPETAAETNDADLLFTLVVQELGDLRMITLYGYFVVLEQNRLLGRVIAEPEFLPARFEEELPTVLAAITARELAEIGVRVLNENGDIDVDARIRLDGRLVGIGEASEGYLPAGEYTLSASRSDGRTVSRQITLTAGERYTVELTIPPTVLEPITVLSRPAGAAVYEGAIWRGFTPMALPRPTDQVEYRIVREGYYESRLSLTADTPPVVERTLIGTDYDWEAQVDSDRRRFYRSFGAFAVSLAGPILLNGVYENLGGLYPGGVARSDLSADEQARLQTRADSVFYAYYGSLALSSGLFGHMIWRLVQYVRTAGEYHRR